LKFTGIYPFEMVHLAASCAYRNTKVGNYVRVGLDCYGDGSEGGTTQIVTVRARPVSVHTVKKGSTVGYNETYVAEKDIRVALLPIGYQNGYRRSMKNFYVLCNGKKYSTIGNICMNHVYVLVDETVDYTSEFIITSPQLPIIELAEKMQTNTHEVLCSFEISDRRYLMGLYD
jgi:alanine racemase